jgi:hypothetical protein
MAIEDDVKIISGIDTNTDYPLLWKAFNRNNYKVVDTGATNKNAIIFFSGNGLYYPSTSENIHRVLFEEDRYEWQNVASSSRMHKSFARIVFVRDTFAAWYIFGINQTLDSVDKVSAKCKELTEGYKVTTVGNSAGGYMAVLIGCLIGAERIFTMSGQFVMGGKHSSPILDYYQQDPNRSKYYDLRPLLNSYEKRKDGKIFYFYPARCNQDIY